MLVPSAMADSGTSARNKREEANTRLLLSFVLRSDSNCVDVGCHGGVVLEEMLRVAPNGRHVAYEPLPRLHRYLCRRFPELDVREVALSDRRGRADFHFVTSRPALSGLRRRPYPPDVVDADIELLTVLTEDLDSSLPESYAPDLIKIDVEGAEELVIKGGLRTIARHKPIVIFEYSVAARCYGTTSESLYSLLCQDAGLRIFDLDGDGPYSFQRFETAHGAQTHLNFIAHA